MGDIPTDDTSVPYLRSLDLDAYIALITTRFPRFARTLWFDRPGSQLAMARLAETSNEFETDSDDGRGDSYRRAQQDPTVRGVGILQLLRRAGRGLALDQWPDDWLVLDALGGDGVLARAWQTMTGSADGRRVPLLTSDIARAMVEQALAYGLPAIRQAAQFLFLRDASFDTVILSYGVHHIPADVRRDVYAEAFRVLRGGGRIVVHDFEQGSPMAAWFQEVVDRYSPFGHRYEHFTRDGMTTELREAGFVEVAVDDMYDPFRVSGRTSDEALMRLLDYVVQMYGLRRLTERCEDSAELHRLVERLILRHMRYAASDRPADGKPSLCVSDTEGGAVAELPRVALVAVGDKPGGPRWR